MTGSDERPRPTPPPPQYDGVGPLRAGRDPSRIGGYELVGRLGAGGMGEVYLARSARGDLVAVKVIREEITGHPEALLRFRREAATVRTIRDARTARLVDASLDAPPYWLATEYVPGPTLRQSIGAEGPLPAARVRELGAELARALTGVHAHGVTHRDLKPQNVILGPDGPRLIDFGIARGTDDTRLTATGMAPGTPGFTAPEVLLRNEVSPAADVFALGATMAYALTGRPPFGGGTAEAVSYRAVHEDVDLEGAADDDPELVALVRACVAKDPAGRPTPAHVVARCEGPGDTLIETSPAGAPQRRLPLRRAVVAALLSAVVATAGVTATRWWADNGGENGARAPEPGGGPTGTSAGGWTLEGSWSLDVGPDPARDGAVEDVRWRLSTDAEEARMGIGNCDRPPQGPAQGSASTSVSYRSGARTADVRLSAEGAGPYRVVVGVKPPGTEGFGHTSAPVRVTSKRAALVYPADFAGAPAVTAAGDWTVVFYQAEGDDRSRWRRLGCTGFHAR
ncbi:serine/threonine-protein kinase [Streptomyces cinereoruber]|uniref:serine/threonine-protein kinase n=1 Tax=Streptomyces cinereoruber TaxID=67260 RepID=UPI0036C0BD04